MTTLRPKVTPRTVACFMATLFALAALAGCGRDKPPAAEAPAVASTAKGEGAASAGAKVAKKADTRGPLAAAYHTIRCGLASSSPPAGLYKGLGYEDAGAFSAAFDAEAAADPDWARGVIAGSLARPCAGAESTK